MNDFIDYINNNVVELRDDEIDHLLACATSVTLSRNDIFLDYGDSAAKIAFVQTGLLEMVMNIKDSDRIIEFVTPHTCAVDYISYLFDKPAELQIRAASTSEILYFRKHTLQKLLNTSDTYKRIEQFINEKSHFEFIQRIRWMYLPPKDRYEIFKKKHPDLMQQVPQYKIASFLNVTPEWLSKIRALK